MDEMRDSKQAEGQDADTSMDAMDLDIGKSTMEQNEMDAGNLSSNVTKPEENDSVGPDTKAMVQDPEGSPVSEGGVGETEGPVSYTHLDVYKRQVLCAGKIV